MKIMPAILGALLLAGCAASPPPRPIVHARAAPRPAARTAPAAKAAEAATASKPVEPSPTTGGITPAAAAAPEAGSAIPFMGFRPMHGQKTPGA